MPELPEVEALSRFVDERARGNTIVRAEVAALSALKTFAPPVSSLVGRPVAGCERRGKYLCLRTDGPWLVIHLALGGWLQWREVTPAAKAKVGKGPLALRVGLSGGAGFDVTEQGTEKRLAIWLVNEPNAVDGIARLGPDPLGPGFDVAAIAAVMHGRAGHVKNVLTDQSAIAGVGNAYSDEALHAAHLSPFKPASKLDGDEVARLHAALVTILADAVMRSLGLPAKGLKGEKKSGLAVHGRTGQACPTCGDTVREVSYATKSLQYCPTCQTGGKPLADRRLSRLLK
ncbi:MAG TPA: DNA-formamidopyrimidine glycosylase family protein [Acidimicrobiales bacterium]|jgi:formamidopyrimidine-DNA glycosylase|nr:DNA-formamidopyrimidine glycosylase family protein [Acidimicrobiales bacterium]